jgi:hypothetical protein
MALALAPRPFLTKMHMVSSRPAARRPGQRSPRRPLRRGRVNRDAGAAPRPTWPRWSRRRRMCRGCAPAYMASLVPTAADVPGRCPGLRACGKPPLALAPRPICGKRPEFLGAKTALAPAPGPCCRKPVPPSAEIREISGNRNSPCRPRLQQKRLWRKRHNCAQNGARRPLMEAPSNAECGMRSERRTATAPLAATRTGAT